MSTSRARVPNELWLEIFNDLPKDTLTSVSLVHRNFSGISRSLLFADFDFHPYAVGSAHAILLPPTAEVERALERLRFWHSEEIAPLVRSCNISPWQKTGPVQAAWTFSPTDTPNILLGNFFEHLACLSGIRRLDAQRVEFTQTGVANLSRLPALDSLRVVNCTITPDALDESIRARLRLTAFSITTTGRGMKRWGPLLSPDHLQQMEMLGDRWLLDTPHSVPIFPRVAKLVMSLRSPVTPRALVALLAKFPALQALSIPSGAIAGEGDERGKVARMLPFLQEYNGPFSAVHLLLACPALTHLTTKFCSPEKFISELQISHTITALAVVFDKLDIATLRKVCAFFPCLTRFWLGVDYIEETEADFLASLPGAGLPPALQHLALYWNSDFDPPPKFENLFTSLAERCPDLTSLWLDGEGFALRWCKARDGTVEETAEDFDNVWAMRARFDAFWEAR